jgi:exonuclease SbcD
VKILHFADLHLGVENYSGGINPETGLSWRLHDFLSAFDEVVDHALNNDIDLVLFCGDAYKSREPSQTHQREFALRIWKLSSAGIPVFLLTGNHDLPNAIGRATTMEIFKTLQVENVTVASKPGTYLIDTGAGPLQIVALPWARRSALLSREDTKNLTIDEVNQRLQTILTERLQQEAAALDRGLPAVLAAHAYLSSAQIGSERGMIMGNDYVLLQSNVARPEFDYVAMGHIHKKQVLGESPPVVYPGSLQRIDFSEENDEKGYFVVDIDSDRGVSFEFQPVNARRFVTIKVDVGEHETDPTRSVIDTIAGHEIKDAVVRVQITIPEQLTPLLNDGEVRRALQDAHAVAAISRDVAREHRLRMPISSAEGLEPLEALKKYLELKKPAVPVESLLEYGQRLIGESDVEN